MRSEEAPGVWSQPLRKVQDMLPVEGTPATAWSYCLHLPERLP